MGSWQDFFIDKGILLAYISHKPMTQGKYDFY
jgi:hypothetical protein